MYRIYILFLLAIGFSAFAVDSSQSILQAKKMSDTTFSISWSPIVDAVKYKVFYDDSSLLDPANPRLLLDSDFMTVTDFEVSKVFPATEYTVIVRGYTMEWKEIWKTLPLHVRTYSAVPAFSLSRDPLVSSETILELWFSRPVDVTQIALTVQNSDTKKNIPIQSIASSPSDLRIALVTLSEKMELSIPYDVTLQKVVSTEGIELPPEKRTPLRIIYAGVLPSLEPLESTPEAVLDPIVDGDSQFSVPDETPPAPVLIDKLPQTWPGSYVLFMFFSVAFYFAQKKLSKRA